MSGDVLMVTDERRALTQGCCQTFSNAQAATPTQQAKVLRLKMLTVLNWKKLDL